MFLEIVTLVLSSASLALGKPMPRATPNLFLVGDSTMALHAASEGIQGWGVEVPTYLTGLTIVNDAISGSSSRSYARDGHFYNLVHNQLQAGDYVVIEFGHNDGGGPTATSTGVAGLEDNTVTTTVTLANGTVEVVHTFGYYVEGMISQVLAAGATPIISSQTPNNPYGNTTTFSDVPSRFVGYASDCAAAYGVAYVNHFAAVESVDETLGATTVNGYYPLDHIHTNTAGAVTYAAAFISGLKCTSALSVLTKYFSSSGAALVSRC